MLTPGTGTLAGITRRSLIELAREAGQWVDMGAADRRRICSGRDEVLVTSTAGGIMPVDGH